MVLFLFFPTFVLNTFLYIPIHPFLFFKKFFNQQGEENVVPRLGNFHLSEMFFLRNRCGHLVALKLTGFR